MAEKFTQGEWRVHKSLPDDIIYSETDEGIVTIARLRYQDVPVEKQDANARLISQAPAMVMVLRATKISLIGDEDYAKHKPLIKTIDAVLAKIEGK